LGSHPAGFERLIGRGGDIPALLPGCLHLYRAFFEAHAPRAGSLARLLSGEESARAERFRFSEHRLRYVVAHGILREILARYVGGSPENIRFGAGPQGKPVLLSGIRSLRFNISHSDRLMLVAVSLDCEVGVDTEPLRRLPDAARLMADYFPGEMDGLGPGATDCAVSHWFLRCWTRYEAALKASGAGLTGRGGPEEGGEVDSLVPAAGHIAAVASVRPLPDRRLIDFRG
jgi:4'-phosphopantetheinyl transferase